MSERFWLQCSRNQLLYIIEGCLIDKPLAEHWARDLGRHSPLVMGEGRMKTEITLLERSARDALYRGADHSQYPPGHKKRHLKIVH